MSAHSDLVRRQALIELLAKSDPFDAQRRHHLVLEGRPDRHNEVLRLASIYIQTKLLDIAGPGAERGNRYGPKFVEGRWADGDPIVRGSRDEVAMDVSTLAPAMNSW